MSKNREASDGEARTERVIPSTRSGLGIVLANALNLRSVAGSLFIITCLGTGVGAIQATTASGLEALQRGDVDACGALRAYGWSADRMEAIDVRADARRLQLSMGSYVLDLATQQPGLEVSVHVYNRPQRSWPFCSHTGPRPDPVEETWNATAGILELTFSPPPLGAGAPGTYQASVRLTGAEFVNARGERVRPAHEVTFKTVVGGWAFELMRGR